MLKRIARDSVISCVALALMMASWRRTWAAPLGVLGGGVLIGLSFWAIWGGLEGWIRPGSGRVLQLVKFFTRYAMLAFAAYVMMARLHIDPVGMLAGVSALGVAAGAEAVRGRRAPDAGRHS